LKTYRTGIIVVESSDLKIQLGQQINAIDAMTLHNYEINGSGLG
jgi:hypothetical protein